MNNQHKSSGHIWDVDASELPMIRSVFSMNCKMPPRRTSFCLPYWVLNCGLIQKEIYFKVSSYRDKWILRNVADLHLYRPHTRVWEDFREKPFTECHGLALIFTMDETPDFQRKFPSSYDFFEFSDMGHRIRTLIHEACNAAKSGKDAFLKVQSILLEVMDALIHSSHKGKNIYAIGNCRTETYDEDFSLRVHNYMDAHVSEKISVGEIARHMNVSEVQLFKRYKKENGYPPMKRFAAMKIELAKLLMMRGVPMDCIAGQTGFYDAFHLSRTFKKLTGISPREYRKKFADS